MSSRVSIDEAKEAVRKAFMEVEVILSEARKNNNALNDFGTLNLIRQRIDVGFAVLQKRLCEYCDDEF